MTARPRTRMDNPALPIVEARRGRLWAVSSYDAETIMLYPQGQQFTCWPMSTRSLPHLRLYWKILREVCRATDRWPSGQHCHQDIKLTTGYVTHAMNWSTGEAVVVPDSIAFDKMSQRDFNVYFDKAMICLAEIIGFDPLDMLPQQERRLLRQSKDVAA